MDEFCSHMSEFGPASHVSHLVRSLTDTGHPTPPVPFRSSRFAVSSQQKGGISIRGPVGRKVYRPTETWLRAQ